MTLDTVFEQEFKKLLAARVLALQGDLSHRQAVPDYADYCFRTGAITALRDMVPDLLDETNTIINER